MYFHICIYYIYNIHKYKHKEVFIFLFKKSGKKHTKKLTTSQNVAIFIETNIEKRDIGMFISTNIAMNIPMCILTKHIAHFFGDMFGISS